MCQQRNKEENTLLFEDIQNGSLQKKILTFRKFQENFNTKNTTHGFS